MNQQAENGSDINPNAIYELAFSRGALPRAILDQQGRWIDFNQAFCDLLGHAREHLLNCRFRDYTHADDVAANEVTLNDLLQGRCAHREVEKRYLHADGTMIWVLMHATRLITAPGRPPLVLTELLDITRQRELQESLRDREERLALALAGADLGMWDWDLRSEAFVFSREATQMLGYRRSELTPSLASIQSLIHDADRELVSTRFREHLRGLPPLLDVICRMRRKAGGYIWVQIRGRVTHRDDRERPVRVCGTIMDTTEQKNLELQLTQLATTDAVTGVYNRRFGLAFLQKACAGNGPETPPLSLILFDLDHFKAINDEHGHEKGDEALRAAAMVARERLRRTDMLARWGGEEFAIVLPNTALEDAIGVAHAILEQLGTYQGLPDRALTASFGVVQHRAAETPQELIARADDLMYRAKRLGRARICTQ